MAPIEGVLLYCSFSLLYIFQSSHVSSLYFCIFMLTLVGENCRWSETTAFLLEFPIDRSINRSLWRELCYIKVQGILKFFQINILCCRTWMEFGDFKEGHTQKASSYEGVGQLIMQLNQKGDYLSLMIEGVVVVHDWNEGKVVPLQCLWPVLVECWGEK